MSDGVTHEGRPPTRTVAAAVGVAPDRLREFAEHHPDPGLEHILALADRPPVDEDTRETIRRWVTAVRERGPPDAAALPGATEHRGGFHRASEDAPTLKDDDRDRDAGRVDEVPADD